MITGVEIVIFIALLIVGAIAYQAHHNGVAIGAQAKADIATAKADVAKDVAILKTDIEVLKAKISPVPTVAAPVSPTPAATTK